MTGAVYGLTMSTQGSRIERWTLDLPERKNALTRDALKFIAERSRSLRGQIVLLEGAGQEAFCAGFDLSALQGPPAKGPAAPLPDAALVEATSAMRGADATFVAAIGGYAIGAGVELACACDVRIAHRKVWFQVPAARLGVVYHAAGLANLRAVFGAAGATRLLLLGERLTADDAHANGALVALAEPETFPDMITQTLDRLLRAAPLSLRGNRNLLRTLAAPQLGSAARVAHEQARREAYASEDHQEARSAVEQRRRPDFKGR